MTIDRVGVSAVSKCVSQLGLIFREQPTDDYGIDAQIETFDKDYASGKLIAVQIKSGDSFFNELKDDKIIFRGEKKHYDYWINHSLPVIIVLYIPKNFFSFVFIFLMIISSEYTQERLSIVIFSISSLKSPVKYISRIGIGIVSNV